MARRIRPLSGRSLISGCATPEQLSDALEACATLHPVYRRLLTLTLEELRLLPRRAHSPTNC
jgi:hypothetical protein